MPELPVDVVIAGGGPNGFMLAAELCRAGVRPIVLERAPCISDEPRANGLVGQVVQTLHMRGLYTAFTEQDMAPVPVSLYYFGGFFLPFDNLEDHSLYTMLTSQPRLVRQLEEHARGLGTEVRWGHELVDLVQRDDHVLITVQGPEGEYEIDARFLVGADGGKSTVRKKLGIDFPGYASDLVGRMGHITLPPQLMTDDGIMVPGMGHLAYGYHRRENGMVAFRMTEPGLMAITIEFEPGQEGVGTQMTFRELHESIERVLGASLPLTPPEKTSAYGLRRLEGQNTRLVEHYRVGNAFLLGDSAHVHMSIGGPGLNLGLQDAVNLGWKLAAQVRGDAPADLLDTYQTERYPVAERVVTQTLAQAALMRPGPEVTAVRTLFGELLKKPDNIAYIADLLAGTDAPYEVGSDHPLCGRMVRDYPLVIRGAESSVYELMRNARPVLIDFTADEAFASVTKDWGSRVDAVAADGAGVPANAMLIRPDGYLAWVAEGREEDEANLRRALGRWFGPAAR